MIIRPIKNSDDPYAKSILQSRESLSAVEALKLELCHRIVDFMKANLLRPRVGQERFGVSESRLSEIWARKIDLFTVDRLVEIYFRLNPKGKIRIR